MKRSENSPKLGNSLQQCLLKDVLNVVSSVPQARQGPRSPSKAPPNHSRPLPRSSTPLIPTHPELDLVLTAKVVILSQDGRLMQYAPGKDINQPPDKVLRLGPSSTAAAREGVDSKHWLLSIVSNKGSHVPSRALSLSRAGWSRRLSIKGDRKRHVSEMILVFDDICMLEDWLTTIRKAIETLSGIPYLLGLVSQSGQVERSWLDVVAMPFKPPPPTSYSRDTACPSRGSTSTSLSSPREAEWTPPRNHALSGSRSSVYTNTELDDMSQSRSSSYSSAQASSQTSLGHPDELALRQYKSTPSLVQEVDAGESFYHQDAPLTFGLDTIAASPDIRTQSVLCCSPSIHIPPSERTPTLAPEAVYLETGNRLLGDYFHSSDESVGGAATMQSWLDNAKVEALKPDLDVGIAESTTPSSAIFRDFGFAWDEDEVASAEDSRLDSGLCHPPSPTIQVVPSGGDDNVHARSRSIDTSSRTGSSLTLQTSNSQRQFTGGLLCPPLPSPIPEFSPTLEAFPQPATWQPTQRTGEDKLSDRGSKSSDRSLTAMSSFRAAPTRTVSSDSSLPMPWLQPPACSALHRRRRKTLPTSAFRAVPSAGPPPQAHLPPLPGNLKGRDNGGARLGASSPPQFQTSKLNELVHLIRADMPPASIPAAIITRSRAGSKSVHALSSSGPASDMTWSPSSSASQPSQLPGPRSQRSSTQAPLPPEEAIAELALQLSILTSSSAEAA